MQTAPKPPELVKFGIFEVDCRTGELRKSGVKIRLQDQPLQILLMLLDCPGEMVTREEIQDRLWPSGMIVEFEHSIGTAVKKLRQALGDDAGTPRYVETLPRRGYRFIAAADSPPPQLTIVGQPRGEAPVVVPEHTPQPEKLSADVQRKHGSPLLTSIAGVAAASVVIISLLARHNSGTRPDLSQPPTLTRVTFDSGLQFGATFSPDARFIAYSADRGGKFDIWVQQIGGTDCQKVTTRPGHNWQPDWSPDGRQIAFRSEGNGGGLFVVPAFGGPERKITSFGYRPRWSPDGTQILFESTFIPELWNKLYLVTPDGQAPHEILSEFFQKSSIQGRSVEWYPDGKHLSIWGESVQGKTFWTVDVSGASALKSGMAAAVTRQLDEISAFDIPSFRWGPQGRSLYFEAETRGVRNLWRVEVDAKTLSWSSLRRLTTGPGPDTDAAISSNGQKLVFTARTQRTRVWSWPLDSRAGRMLGEGKPVTSPGLDAWMPDISRDGKRLVFVTQRFGKWQLWEASMVDAGERLLLDGAELPNEPRWSPDGTRVLYSRLFNWRGGHTQPGLLPEGGGNEQELVSEGFQSDVTDWSPDGQFIVSTSHPGENESEGGRKTSILLLPISAAPHAEARARLVTSTRGNNICQMRFSPDGHWIAFELIALVRGSGASNPVLYVVPVSGGPWIRITDGKSWDDKPRWSPDGKLLYFMSSRTGLFNVWATRFDGSTGHTIGEPFPVTVFENPGLLMAARDPSLLQISVAENRLVLPLAAVSGNIWLLENVD